MNKIKACVHLVSNSAALTISHHREHSVDWVFGGLDFKNIANYVSTCNDCPRLSSGRHKLIIWPVDLLTQSMVPRDLDTDEPYPLPFAVSLRGDGFHIPSMQLRWKMHVFLWRVQTICVTKALTAQSILLTKDPFFTARWDNSQTAPELTNVTA